jgi:hypothetical protein
MIQMAGHSDAVEILLAVVLGREYPPPGVEDTARNRALRDDLVRELADWPPGMIVEVPADQVIGPSGPSVAACTDAPAAWVSRSGVFAIGMLVDEPAELTTTSAPPSALVESITTNAPTVENAAPAATVSAVAPWTLATPVVVVLGAPTVSAYGCSHLLQNPASGKLSCPALTSCATAFVGPQRGQVNWPLCSSRTGGSG